MPDKPIRKIGFMRLEEKKNEEKRMRTANHVKKCNDFAEELYQLLLIFSPNETENIIKQIKTILYWNNK